MIYHPLLLPTLPMRDKKQRGMHMYDRFFGLYLLSNGLLTREQLAELAAIPENYMNTDGLGDATATLGNSLAHTQFADLAPLKEPFDFSLPAFIVEKNFLPLTQVKEAIVKYQEECSLAAADMDGLKGLDYGIIVRVLLDFSHNPVCCHPSLPYDYVALLLRNIVQLLNQEPIIWDNYEIKTHPLPPANNSFWTVSQPLQLSKRTLHTRLLMDEKLLIAIANQYSAEKITAASDMAIDSVKEFLNVNNGLLAANLANIAIQVNPGVVSASRGYTPDKLDGFIIPVGLFNSQLQLLLSCE